MNVYILTSDYYGENFVVGVFAGRETAEQYADRFLRPGYKIRETVLLVQAPEYELTPVVS